jgi:diguanylate cyclase (GGDEF)-like protein
LSLYRTVANRIGTDMRLAMILLFAVITVLGISPFAVARALNGEWAVFALDVGLIVMMVANASFAWVTGRVALVGIVNAVGVTAACALLAGPLGTAGLFWAYTLILANFMLAPRPLATACGLVTVAAMLASGNLQGTLATTAFVVSAALVMLYSFIFAKLTDVQREQLHRLATRDPLTGVANRRSMEIELADALRLHHARGESATLAVLDLDHFKLVNDQHGHEAGDRVLVAFADRVQDCIRKRDRLFRFGGEEFVLLLPGADHAGARVALEKIRHAVASETFGPGLAVTASVGASLLRHDDDWPAWLARADAALFRAKREGRDRVEFDEQPSPTSERRLRGLPHRTRA